MLLAIIYVAFISLGLPDGLLGAAWPTMYPSFGVPVSYAGIVSIVISLGTIASSLLSDRLTRRWGTGLVTAVSVVMTAVALCGFSVTGSFWLLIVWAIPYGLGAGSVDASLNNYVAVHYSSAHMSWLHCMWGIGASAGPYVMGALLTRGHPWNTGYATIGIIQIVLAIGIVASLPLWRKRAVTAQTDDAGPLSLRTIVAIPGAKQVMICFFCYCAIESTAGLWASSYLTLVRGVSADVAATCGSLFFVGITLGRAISGFLTVRWSDQQLIRGGAIIMFVGAVMVFVPVTGVAIASFVVIGLGCAPVYPCVIHSTPHHFGAHRSQAIIGVQMASAYTGTLVMPAVFGVLAENVSAALLPLYLVVLIVVMAFMHERLVEATRGHRTQAR
nr:MFS transporter [Nanchangia anserum]